jgi:uncharacterized protein
MKSENKVFYRSKDGAKLCGIFMLPKNARGYTLLAHGITMDKNEWNNFYVDIAHQLFRKNIASLRFDFRGHGESGGTQKDITIMGELLDIEASANKIYSKWNDKISIIGTSFGAGPAILYAAKNNNKIKCLILLCPVLDYIATFLKPITPWAKETFNEKGFKYLENNGYILLDGDFKLGANLIEEFKLIKPYELLSKLDCPVLMIHGDKDTMVPYKISKKYSSINKKSEFITLKGADHGFIAINDETGESKESYKNKKFVIDKIMEWVEK